MKLRCPQCGQEFDWDQAAQGRDQEEMIQLAAAFGADWSLVSEYLNGFRVRPGGAMALNKGLRLTKEVRELWEAGKFCLGGQWYTVGREEFREALKSVANRELSGLKNHNYLKQVLKAAARETSKRLERELRERERGLRTAGEDARPTGAIPTDPAWLEKFKELGRALRRARTPEERARAQAAYDDHVGQGEATCRT